MDRLRRALQRLMLRVDHLYSRWHRLEPVGEVLLAGRERHRGAAIDLPDGTRVAPGDLVGTLHFHNERFTRLDGTTSRRAARQFGRLFLESRRLLAARASRELGDAEVVAYRAVTWLPATIGGQFGFVARPFPDGIRKRLLALYFRFLVWTFAPAPESRRRRQAEPIVYWITRRELLGQASGHPAAPGGEA